MKTKRGEHINELKGKQNKWKVVNNREFDWGHEFLDIQREFVWTHESLNTYYL